MNDQSLKTLFALSEPTPEVEDDMDDDNLAEKAVTQYDFMNIISALGNENFREIYSCFKNILIGHDRNDQINFCRALLVKVEEIYDFTFFNVDLDYEEPQDIYSFIEWLEYDNADFLFTMFNGLLQNDIYSIDIIQFVNDEWENIEKKIDVYFMSNRFKMMFIRTNNKQNLINFIVRNSELNKSYIREKFYMKGVTNEVNN